MAATGLRQTAPNAPAAAPAGPTESSIPGSAPGRRLHRLIAASELLELAAVCDPFGARLAREAGFAAMTLAGYAIGAHLPLSRTLELDSVEATVRMVVAAAEVPVLVDGDIGGDAAALTRRLEAAGAAGVQLSNAQIPDQLPQSEPATRELAHEALTERVAQAVAARTSILVTARCDLTSGDTYEVGLARIRALAAAGCDAVLVHASDVDLERLPRDVPDVALIYAGLPGSRESSTYPAEPLARWGYAASANKYHRCYCRRMASASAEGSEVAARG